MSKNKMAKCPKCGEKSLVEIRHNIYQCVSCDHRKDFNDFDWNWLMPAIAVICFTGLIINIFGGSILNKNAPSNPNNNASSLTSQLQQASIGQAITPENIPANPPIPKPKAIAKAISGNQVMLDLKGKPTTVLLCGLNSATQNSQYFSAATNSLQQLLDRTGADNLMLTAIANDDDVPIVEIYDRRENISLNAQQAASGYAFSSQVLAKPCRDRTQIVNAAQQAQTAKKGVWAN